jgi:alpha-L-rhamnosidase
MYRKHDGQFLGDWIAPNSRKEFGLSVQALYFNNCVYAMNLETFVNIARILNKQEDVTLYSERLKDLLPAIRSNFYDSTAGTYSDGNQVQQAFAAIVGLPEGDELTLIENSIANDMLNIHPYFDMGSAGVFVMMRYLTERPQTAEIATTILNKTIFPGYGYFISQGESTWAEDWKIDVPSKIHTCYTGVAGWFTKGLCGIQPDKNCAGYKHFFIKPFIVSEIDFAEATEGSPYGEIFSRWERKDNRIILSVTVPPNTSATVYIPASHPEQVTENGNSLKNAEGVTQKNTENGYVVVETVSGKYQFVVTNDK